MPLYPPKAGCSMDKRSLAQLVFSQYCLVKLNIRCVLYIFCIILKVSFILIHERFKMMIPDQLWDIANSCFLVVAIFFLLLDVRAVYRDKKINGLAVPTRFFFVVWTAFTVAYWAHLDQWFSFYVEIALLVISVMYVSMIMYYYKKGDGDSTPP